VPAFTLTPERVQVNVEGLAETITGTRVAATPNDPNSPPQLNGQPDHLRFTFDDDQLSPEVDYRQRQILIYPRDGYEALFQGPDVELFQRDVNTLTLLAVRRPEVVTGTIPVIPASTGSQAFHSNINYPTFPGGIGTRFITAYAQDEGPIDNDDFFYTFQGGTVDERYFVMIFYPVSVKDWQGAASAEEAARFLESVPADGFTPSLIQLDAMVQSLHIQSPREAAAPAKGLGFGVGAVRVDAGSLANSITGTRVTAVPNDPNVPPFMNGNPEFLRFSFGDDRLTPDVGIDERQILIYPVDTYRDLFQGQELDQFNKDISTTIELLTTRPQTVTGVIPVLPYFGASQGMQAQVRTIDSPSGAGVRFITFYSQDAIPITNDNIFYTYQGMTPDGKYRISMIYPIDAKGIPNSDSPEETTAYLNSLAAADFTPSLDALDSMAQSIRVNVPGRAASLRPASEITSTLAITFTPKIPEASQDGVCFSNSLRSSRPDAWRCNVENGIYDPCFTAADGQTVVCGQAPIFTSPDAGFKLDLQQPLPPAIQPSPNDDIDPWMIRTQDGNLCVLMSGATAQALGKPVRFGCIDGSVVLGDAIRIGDVDWVEIVRAEEGAESLNVTSTKPVAVIGAWR
jgi:hypothetical protein